MDLICLLFFILGIIVGIIILKIIINSKIVTGVVQIDHETGLCRFKITNETLSNPKLYLMFSMMLKFQMRILKIRNKNSDYNGVILV